MTEEQTEETFTQSEPPVGPAVEPSEAELAAPSPELEAKIEREQEIKTKTEAMAAEDGYPAETADGNLVMIVEKRPTAQGTVILVDADGNEYDTSTVDGVVTPLNDNSTQPNTATKPDPVESGVVESGVVGEEEKAA